MTCARRPHTTESPPKGRRFPGFGAIGLRGHHSGALLVPPPKDWRTSHVHGGRGKIPDTCHVHAGQWEDPRDLAWLRGGGLLCTNTVYWSLVPSCHLLTRKPTSRGNQPFAASCQERRLLEATIHCEDTTALPSAPAMCMEATGRSRTPAICMQVIPRDLAWLGGG